MGLRVGLGLLLVCLAAAMVEAQVSSHYVGQPAATASASSVKNEPFSADVTTQYDRLLDNGARIHRENRGKIYRDSQGRVRTETEAVGAQPGADRYEHITITDPVQQVIIHLNVKARTATLYRFGDVGPTAPNLLANGDNPPSKRGQKQDKPEQMSSIHVGPAPTSDAPIAAGAATGSRSVNPGHETVSRSGMADIQTGPGHVSTETLGTMKVEGVMATGTRTTRTIPAGTMGNDKPIISISESWFSGELKTMILNVSDDGQAGRSSMKLTNIVRSEPGAQLFQVPSDYTVKENVSAIGVQH